MQKKLTYESKLRRSIFSNFILGSLFTVVFIIISGLITIFIWQSRALTTAGQQIQNIYSAKEAAAQLLFERIEAEDFNSLLASGTGTERIFGHFYSLYNRDTHWLVLTDEEGELVFTSSNERLEQTVLLQYLSLLSRDEDRQIQHKITRDINNSAYYIYARPLYSGNTKIGYGYLLSNNTQVDTSLTDYPTRYVIADQYRNVYIANDQQFISGTIPKLKEDVFEKSYYLDERQLYLSNQIEIAPMITAYVYLPLIDIQTFTQMILALFIVMLFVHFIQTRLLAKRIAHRQSATINRLVEETKLIEQGYKFHLTIPDDVDFAFLTGHINQMIDQTQALYNKSLMSARQKVVAEKKMLEAQFNPHFLYNTLEAIRITSQFDPQTTNQLILGLNRILRYSIQDPNHSPTLDEDFDKINDYLAILKVRFDQFNYQIIKDINNEIVLVPKLFLMPLIENAIKYGMAERSDLEVVIKAEKMNQHYVFKVLSNGPEFSKDINDIIIAQQNENETYHGLANTYLRLSLFYQELSINNLSEADLNGVIITVKGVANNV